MKKIKYNITDKINIGTEAEPIIEKRKGVPASMEWNEANEEIAKAEAYNGEYEITPDDGQPDPTSEPTTDEIVNALLGVTP